LSSADNQVDAGAVDAAPLSIKEAGLAGLAGLLIAVALFAARADRMPGDAAGLVGLMADPGGPFVFWYHLGYAWLARLTQSVLGGPLGLNVRETLELLSALAAGASAALCHVTLRRLGTRVLASALVAALLASTAAFLHHGTTIEVHTVQLAAGWLGLCLMARGARLAPLALFAQSLLAGLIVAIGHQTGPLLFPGLVLASIWTAGPALGRRDQISRFAIACSAFLCALGISRYLTSVLSPFDNLKNLADFTSGTAMLTKGASWDFALTELLLPLHGLALVLIIVLGTRLRTRPMTWLGLALALVPWIFFLGFGESTEGGYFLGSSMGALVLLAIVLDRFKASDSGQRATAAIALLLVSPPIGLFQFATQFEARDERAAARITEAQKLMPNGGTLVAVQYTEHTLNGQFENINELNVGHILRKFIRDGGKPQDTQLFLSALFQEQLAQAGPGEVLLLDWTWSYRRGHHGPRWLAPKTTAKPASKDDAGDPLHVTPEWEPYIEALRAGLDQRWRLVEYPHDWGLYLRIEASEQ
jgi:hypothetical protein